MPRYFGKRLALIPHTQIAKSKTGWWESKKKDNQKYDNLWSSSHL
jgi:hypothetical protein